MLTHVEQFYNELVKIVNSGHSMGYMELINMEIGLENIWKCFSFQDKVDVYEMDIHGIFDLENIPEELLFLDIKSLYINELTKV